MRSGDATGRGRWLYVLGALLLVVGIGTALYNLWPDLAFRMRLTRAEFPYPSVPAETAGVEPTSRTVPDGRRVVVPRVRIDVAVSEGDVDTALKTGAYRHETTARPGEQGNTVIAAHRTSRQFALLHLLEPGDDIIVYWDGVEFDYAVTRVFEVTAVETSILDVGSKEQLTLYTCTPRFLGNKRTVVIAERVPAPLSRASNRLGLAVVLTEDLVRAGVVEERQWHLGICTAHNTEHVYSYRAEGCTGRHAVLAALAA